MNIIRLIKKLYLENLKVPADAQMDKRILGDSLKAMKESKLSESVVAHPNIWRIIMKSKMVKSAAAAVIIVAALVGIKVLFGLGEQPAEVPVAEPPVPNAVVADSVSPIDIELRQVRQMYAAGDVKGLAAVLAEGQFESKVLAADYLAQMEDGVKALQALQNVQAQYGKDDLGNPFTDPVEKLRSRMGAASGFGEQASATHQSAVSTALDRDPTPRAVVVEEAKQTQPLPNAESADATAGMQAELSAGQVLTDSTNGPVLTKGVSGSAYYFDGMNDYIDFGDNEKLEGLSQVTIAAWVYWERSRGDGQDFIAGKELMYKIDINKSNGTIRLLTGVNGWAETILTSSQSIMAGSWHYIAATYDGSTKHIYIDGIKDPHSVVTSQTLGNNAGAFSIGAYDNSVSWEDFFTGIIDEVAVFDRALSDEEIEQLYQSPGSLQSNEPGLIGYWNFDSDRGEIVKDSSRYGNDGRLSESGGVTTIPESPDEQAGPELVEGVSGYAYYFDGRGDYIDIGDDPSIQTEVLTIAAWVATSDQRRWQTIVSYERGSHAVSVREGKAYYGWQWIFIPGLSGTTEVRTGQWTFVAVTRDSNYRVSVYVNGELENSFVNDTKSGFSRTAKIGGDVYDDEYFHGSIDDVAIFNRPLSAEEIQRLYQNPGSLQGNEPGLVGYWNFDNDEVQLVKDASPYGNHGTPGTTRRSAPASPPDVLHVEPAEPAPGPDGECTPELTEGASGYGYYFDGDADYIEIPPIEGLGVEHTKMLWANPDVSPPPQYDYLIDQDQGKYGGNNNWIELVGTNENGSKIRTGYDSGNFFDSNGRIQLGYWNHIAVVTTSDGEVRTYINGAFDSSHSGFSVANEPEGILIGATSSDRRANFKGIIDEVAFFNRALSDDEIWQIYQNNGRLRGNEAGLVGYWNFDRDDGDTVRDMSRYNNNGKLGPADPAPADGSTTVTHLLE